MSRVVLVEGEDDESVISHLLCGHGFEFDLQLKILTHPKFGDLKFINARGVDNLLIEIRTVVKSAADSIAIILDRDFDSDPWPSIRSRLIKAVPARVADLPLESDPIPRGGLNVKFGNDKRLGVWIMPDNESRGMLETFVSTLIPAVDPLWPLAQSAVASIPKAHRRFGNKSDKACIHTWLAWQEDPGARMGSAINKKYFEANSLSAEPFLQWLTALLTRSS